MAEEAERGKVAFLQRLSAFNEERGASNNTSPTISKQPLDLFLLYNLVKNRGGFTEVCRNRHWKECAQQCGITITSSAAYTLKKQYIKHLLPFECKYDRNDIPVEVVIQQTESASKSKQHGKHGKGSAPSPGPGDSNSQGSISSASTCSYPTSGTPTAANDSTVTPFLPQQSPAAYPPQQPVQPAGQMTIGAPQSQPNPGQFVPQQSPAVYPSQQSVQPPTGQMSSAPQSQTGAGQFVPQYNGYSGYGHPAPGPHAGWVPSAGPGVALAGDSVSARDPFSDEMPPEPADYNRPAPQPHLPPPQQQVPNGYQAHYRQQTPPQTSHASQAYYGPHQGQHYEQYRDSRPGYDQRNDLQYGPPAAPPQQPHPQQQHQQQHQQQQQQQQPQQPQQQAPVPRSSPSVTPVPSSSPSPGVYPASGGKPAATNSYPNYNPRLPHQMSHHSVHPHPVQPDRYPSRPESSDYNRPAPQTPLPQPQQVPNGYQAHYRQQTPPQPSHSSQAYYGPHQSQRYEYRDSRVGYDQRSDLQYGSQAPPPPPQQQQQQPHQQQQPQQQQHQVPVPRSTPSSTPVSSPSPNVYPASGGKPTAAANSYPNYNPRLPHQMSHHSIHPHSVQPDRYPSRPESGDYSRSAPQPPIPQPQQQVPNGYQAHYRQQTPQQPHTSQGYYGPHQSQRYEFRDSRVGYDQRNDLQYGAPAAPPQHAAGPPQQQPLPPSGSVPPHSQSHSIPGAQPTTGHPLPPPLVQGKPSAPGMGPSPLPPSLYGPNRDQPQRYPMPPHTGSTHPGPVSGPHALHHPQQQPFPATQAPYAPPFMQQPLRREMSFPPDTVEGTVPKMVKRRRMTARDVSQIEAWRLLMCLKSGLLAESTWALDVLSVLLHDDNTYLYFGLQSMPGLLNTLLEHFRKYLLEIFDGLFETHHQSDFIKKGEPNPELTRTSGKTCDDPVEKSGDNPVETNDDDPDSPAVCRYRIRRIKNRRSKKWYEIDEDLKENSYPECNRIDGLTACDTVTKSKSSNCIIPSAESVPACEQDHKPLILLNGSMNFTMKSRDGKPVKIVNCKNGMTLTEVEKGWKRLNHCRTPDAEKCEQVDSWDETCHILTQFASKEKFVRFVKLIHSKKDGNLTSSQDDRPMSDMAAKVIQESQVPAADSLDGAKRTSRATDPDTFYPRFRESDAKRRKYDLFDELEEEAYCRDQPPLNAVDDYCDGLSRRCLCLSTLIRNLSFVPQNDVDMARHEALLLVLSRLMLLHHEHPTRKRNADAPVALDLENDALFNEDEVKTESKALVDEDASGEIDDGSDEWYWDTMHLLLENTLVTLANIAGQLDLSPFPEEVSLPLLDGLLHWAVCPSSFAQDNLPMTSISNLSPQRLALEILVKLSIRESNVDLILATPPWQRLDRLFTNLSKLLSRNEDQTLREFALVLLANLSSADTGIARSVALTRTAIPQLISFVEQSEHSAMSVVHTHGMGALRDNPELMGTTLDMVRRAALCLRYLSRIPENRSYFMIFQQRLLSLVMSQILDQGVAAIMADVIYECSLSDPSLMSSRTDYLPLIPSATAPTDSEKGLCSCCQCPHRLCRNISNKVNGESENCASSASGHTVVNNSMHVKPALVQANRGCSPTTMQPSQGSEDFRSNTPYTSTLSDLSSSASSNSKHKACEKRQTDSGGGLLLAVLLQQGSQSVPA